MYDIFLVLHIAAGLMVIVGSAAELTSSRLIKSTAGFFSASLVGTLVSGALLAFSGAGFGRVCLSAAALIVVTVPLRNFSVRKNSV